MIKEKPLVSVIIPVYNGGEYIERILINVCNQTYVNLQVIVVNDGSDDDTEAVVKRFKEDKRIVYLAKENGGVSSARNLGLSKATGDFIRFIDADDEIPADSIEMMIGPFLTNQSLDLVIGNFDYDITCNYYNEDGFMNQIIDLETFTNLFCKSPKSFYYGAPWNKLYKKSIIDEYNMTFDEKLRWCEDFIFNLEYYSKCQNIFVLHVDNGIYKYNDNLDSITKKIDSFSDEEALYVKEQRINGYNNFLKNTNANREMLYHWLGANLYGKLSEVTKISLKKMSMSEKYKEFKHILLDDGMESYVCFMAEQKTNEAFIWKMLKHSIEKNKYIGSYSFFVIKGLYAKFLIKIMPTKLSAKLKSKTPKQF